MHATLAAATQTLLADAGRGRQTLRKGRGGTRQINKLHNNIISPVTAKKKNQPTAKRHLAPSQQTARSASISVCASSHARACFDTHECPRGWSSQVNATEIGLERDSCGCVHQNQLGSLLRNRSLWALQQYIFWHDNYCKESCIDRDVSS